MKFNKNKLGHWVILLLGALNAVIAAFARRLGLLRPSDSIVLYGHVLNGNLKPLYDRLEDDELLNPVYVTMFPQYKKILRLRGIKVYSTSSLLDSFRIAKARAFVTDHGSHFLFPIYKHTDIKFADVWHGIPYKGWDENSFGEQKHYDEVWLSSPYMVEIFKTRCGFQNHLIATGYGRTDALVNGDYTKERLIKKYDLPDKKLILVALTWKQDDQNRSIIPFDETIEDFFERLDNIGKASDSLVIFRAHLNVGDNLQADRFSHVKTMSYSDYPIAEEFLGAADLLITDWSSIAFDQLVTKKPIVYLDVKPPFEHGLTLDGSYRFGPVVKDLAGMEKATLKYVGRTDEYRNDYKSVIDKTMEAAYGNLADGNATQRYIERLHTMLNHGEPNDA